MRHEDTASFGMRLGRPKRELALSEDESRELQLLARRPKSAQALALRARIVLACAEGRGNREVAALLRVTPVTVGKWRRRFLRSRVAGLLDERRPGAPRRISDEQVGAVITATLEALAEGSNRESTRRMAAKTGLSQSAIVRIWRAFGLQPYSGKGLKIASDLHLEERDYGVAGLYFDRREHIVVLCAYDEQNLIVPQGQRPAVGLLKQAGSGDTLLDYSTPTVRPLADVFNTASQDGVPDDHNRRRRHEFLAFLRKIDGIVTDGREVHLVIGNHSVQRLMQIRAWLSRRPRYHIHLKATSGLWLSFVERLLAKASGRRGMRSAVTFLVDLNSAIQGYLSRAEAGREPFVWIANTRDNAAAC